MLWLTECLSCHNYLYHLADGRLKCSKCNKRRSKERINKIITLIYAFVNNESALHTSKRVHISYVSTQSYFNSFRLLCASIDEEEYQLKRHNECEYEEYFYIQESKKHKKEAIFDAYNFLTFDYNSHIYTLLMPSLKQYKQQFLEDSVEGAYIEEFHRFKRQSYIIKVKKRYNNIVDFWEYFEKYICIYKGVDDESFIYFLKEFEFKYNHTKEEAIELLIKKYFKDN